MGLKEWFNSIDENGDGMITYDQFARSANDPDVLAFAESLEIELFDLKQFFNVLSANNKRPVNLENFVIGCIKLKGMAKSMDLMDLMYAQKQATEEQRRQAQHLEQYVKDALSVIIRSLAALDVQVHDIHDNAFVANDSAATAA